jgi:hypothetical protein
MLNMSQLPRWKWKSEKPIATGTHNSELLFVRLARVHPVPWMWTLAFGQHEDRSPTHGYAETPEAAMAAFVKSWRRE